MTIGVVAPSSRIDTTVADRVKAVASGLYGEAAPRIVFHQQCFLSSGHFAGDDDTRAAAFVEVANDPKVDAVWFARGGYGAGRMLERAVPALGAAADAKSYLGYSDAGFLLAALYRHGIGRPAHGPMPSDINRSGGEKAVGRALSWLVDRDPAALEPSQAAAPATPMAAFNLTILGHLMGTPWQPDLTDHVLMLEDVDEHMYRLDRALWHVFSGPAMRRIAGLRLGRVSDIPPNDPDFVLDEVRVAEHWCREAGVPWLGRADIGHDVGNRVVVFPR